MKIVKALTGSDSHGGLAKHVLQWTGDDPWAVSRDAAPDLLRAVFGRGCACTCGGAGEGGASGGVRSFFKGSGSGLVDSHAYTVIWHGDAAGVELVQLRNPWGSDGEWTGDWSDGSAGGQGGARRDPRRRVPRAPALRRRPGERRHLLHGL